jgi:hypothetical protein
MNRPGVLRDNSLSVAFGALFLVTVVGESLAGWRVEGRESFDHGGGAVSYWTYITSSSFGRAVLENWQSEYLQFVLFIFLTIWLTQRGSPESKEPGDEGLESDAAQRVGKNAPADAPRWAVVAGLRRSLYSSSLLLVMGALFLLSWLGHSITGWTVYNQEAAEHGRGSISWLGFVASAEFWEQTLQNWQSEFLAVGSFTIFAVFLRQRGSSESKPVGAPHTTTDVSG